MGVQGEGGMVTGSPLLCVQGCVTPVFVWSSDGERNKLVRKWKNLQEVEEVAERGRD